MDEKLYKAEEKNKLQRQGSWLPLAVIGAGVVLLFANLFMVDPMSFLWPGFVIVPGLLLLWPSAQSTAVRQHPLSFLAVPGALLTAVGTPPGCQNCHTASPFSASLGESGSCASVASRIMAAAPTTSSNSPSAMVRTGRENGRLVSWSTAKSVMRNQVIRD
ncbi:MAG: hypothetical protein KDE56_23710 [Anaerolineales bacterium]|nr:hypothetical protein [Anaerolineales bacterium]